MDIKKDLKDDRNGIGQIIPIPLHPNPQGGISETVSKKKTHAPQGIPSDYA